MIESSKEDFFFFHPLLNRLKMDARIKMLEELSRVEDLLVSETAHTLSEDFPEKVVDKDYLKLVARFLVFSGKMNRILASPYPEAEKYNAHRAYVETRFHIENTHDDEEEQWAAFCGKLLQ